MKNLHTTFILTGFILIFSIGMRPAEATGNLEVNTLDNEKMVRMELNTPASVAISVRLYDEADRIFYNDQISAGTTFEDEFDFSTVRKGTYRLVSELGSLRYNRIFQVDENLVEFKESYYTIIPQFKKEQDQLMVHMINNQENSLGVSIEDEYGRVFDAYYDAPGDTFERIYALDDLSSGDYVIHLISGKEMFSYEFTVE